MSTPIYHFTSSAHLPRIMRARELRPFAAGNLRGFVYATESANGDRTATVSMSRAAQEAYREGTLRRVRLTLSADDFEPWLNVLARYPE